jgi:hypothetical protein
LKPPDGGSFGVCGGKALGRSAAVPRVATSTKVSPNGRQIKGRKKERKKEEEKEEGRRKKKKKVVRKLISLFFLQPHSKCTLLYICVQTSLTRSHFLLARAFPPAFPCQTS